jgi:hypothetical protein
VNLRDFARKKPKLSSVVEISSKAHIKIREFQKKCKDVYDATRDLLLKAFVFFTILIRLTKKKAK